MENIIAARELQVERKHFFIEFRENDRGRFLKITEEAHGRRNSVIIPSTGLEEFDRLLSEVVSTHTQPVA
ncbi:MAG: DNA-binding protein [Chthoniobacterales bacterium]